MAAIVEYSTPLHASGKFAWYALGFSLGTLNGLLAAAGIPYQRAPGETGGDAGGPCAASGNSAGNHTRTFSAGRLAWPAEPASGSLPPFVPLPSSLFPQSFPQYRCGARTKQPPPTHFSVPQHHLSPPASKWKIGMGLKKAGKGGSIALARHLLPEAAELLQ